MSIPENPQPQSAQKTPVEVRANGDDGLTQRLQDSIVNEFRESAEFEITQGKLPGTLIVTIPTNVSWEQVGRQTKLLYQVSFSERNQRNLGVSTGSCWESNLAKCAANIVADAKTAAKNLR